MGSVGGVGSVGRDYKTYVSSTLLCRTTLQFTADSVVNLVQLTE
ncbi:hypothetical protein [Okeania sp. SIO3I5]|nr:hypothetical protein [Okeania sp. SIO3I5]